jgi:hypothetical protein
MDIAKRLRARAKIDPSASQDLNEAANEIVRLRKELKRLNDGIDAFERSIKWKHDNWLKIKPIFEQNKQPLNHTYDNMYRDIVTLLIKPR